MVNPLAGEVVLRLDGKKRVARLTLGALAEVEAELGGSVLDLVRRFEGGSFSAREVLVLLFAGLKAAGWKGSEADLRQAEIEGGLLEAARIAAQMLVRAFSVPGQE